MSEHNTYTSPLSGRYASPQMQEIWSNHRKFSTWRRLWLALAESEQALGLDISDTQVEELRNHLDDIDYDAAAKHGTHCEQTCTSHHTTRWIRGWIQVASDTWLYTLSARSTNYCWQASNTLGTGTCHCTWRFRISFSNAPIPWRSRRNWHASIIPWPL